MVVKVNPASAVECKIGMLPELTENPRNPQTTNFFIKELRTEMGALPHESGVAFHVWVPHANAMYVTGAFNN